MLFEEKKEKDLVWSKLRDNLRVKTNIVVTQDSSTKRQIAMEVKQDGYGSSYENIKEDGDC